MLPIDVIPGEVAASNDVGAEGGEESRGYEFEAANGWQLILAQYMILSEENVV
jgi:hypothetical protein